MKNTIKVVSIVILVVCLLVLNSCMNPVHFFKRRPENFPGRTYTCEDYNIEFTVFHEEIIMYYQYGDVQKVTINILGKMTVDGVEYEFYAYSGADYGMVFTSTEISENKYYYDEDSLWEAKTKYRLVYMSCEYERDGSIIATVTAGNLLEPGIELVFQILETGDGSMSEK